MYTDFPFILDNMSGFYVLLSVSDYLPNLKNSPETCFQPNESNVVKFMIHHAGYTHMQSHLGKSFSPPRTFVTHEDGATIPRVIVQLVRLRVHDFVGM
jgi:hypothetical protein